MKQDPKADLGQYGWQRRASENIESLLQELLAIDKSDAVRFSRRGDYGLIHGHQNGTQSWPGSHLVRQTWPPAYDSG